ncbi:Uncharacterized protein GBIM_08783 [Gryllus bimaculatus]|nr:Uncharacterized protein GBIM_08783 [Gryllus bimaculatus]
MYDDGKVVEPVSTSGTFIPSHPAHRVRIPSRAPPLPAPLPAEAAAAPPGAETADLSDGAQYSLLQTVVEACQKKRQCKFQTSPRTFGGDPCPGVRKYVEVAYKCRPLRVGVGVGVGGLTESGPVADEFRSKVACEDDSVTLKCNPNARIAVYSASFGRTEYESIQCPQPQGVPEETCLVSYATEAVMRRCHGKRRCQLTAGAEMFGNPCRPQSRMYLKVVYTCVPRAVLREHLVESTGEDETDLADDDDDDFDIDDAAAFSPSPNVEGGPGARTGGAADADDRPPGRGPAAGAAGRTTPGPPPLAKASGGGGAADVGKFGGKFGPNTTPYLNYNNLFVPPSHPTGPTTIKDMLGDDVSDEKVLESNVNCTTVVPNENTEVIGFISEWINAYNYIAQNQEKFYLYLILSVTAGLLLFLGLVIGRLLVQRHRTKRNTKFHQPVPEQTLPNGFADDISEVEADIDLTTPVPMVAVHSPPASVAEVVRFNTGTLRRGAPGEADSTAPRSLNRSGNSQYYYG